MIETFWIQKKRNIIKKIEVPKNFNNFRIVFISDIHIRLFFSKNRLNKLVKKVNTLKPEIIILGGDYVYKSLF